MTLITNSLTYNFHIAGLSRMEVASTDTGRHRCGHVMTQRDQEVQRPDWHRRRLERLFALGVTGGSILRRNRYAAAGEYTLLNAR